MDVLIFIMHLQKSTYRPTIQIDKKFLHEQLVIIPIWNGKGGPVGSYKIIKQHSKSKKRFTLLFNVVNAIMGE